MSGPRPVNGQEIENCFKGMSGAVYRHLYQRTYGDRELSEDLLQETFKKAVLNWDELQDRDPSQRLAWLMRVASNTAIDHFRREGVARAKLPVIAIAEDHVSDEAEVYRLAMTSMAIQSFDEMTALMPLKRRQVAFLKWRCGWRNHQIAAALGISPSGVSQHVKNARQDLMKLLGPDARRKQEGGDD